MEVQLDIDLDLLKSLSQSIISICSITLELPVLLHSLTKLLYLKISFKVNNLLKQKVRIAHFYQDKYYITQEYDPGRSFSVSIQFNN